MLSQEDENVREQITIDSLVHNQALDEQFLEMLYEYDKGVYLSRLSAVCHGISSEFHAEMTELLKQTPTLEKTVLKVPSIKTKTKSLQKIERKFESANVPKSAQILDMLRASITFHSVDDLINGITDLFETIRNRNKGLKEIVRVKNGFTRRSTGKYQDIKMNVIFESEKLSVAVVCEIQLILRNFLEAKKKAKALNMLTRKVELGKIMFETVTDDCANKLLRQAVRKGDLKGVYHSIVLGANVNAVFAVCCRAFLSKILFRAMCQWLPALR